MPGVMPYQIPFRHLCNLIQIADGDIDKTVADLRKSAAGPSDDQLPGLLVRCRCAKYWAEECAPEEFRFRLRKPAAPDAGGSVRDAAAGGPGSIGTLGSARYDLSGKELAGIRLLRDRVVARIGEFADDKACAQAIYQAAEEAGLEGKELFRAAYQALIGKDQGPRLANFIRSIEQNRLMEILADY
jgi:lysyl-tRNA synthetase class 1